MKIFELFERPQQPVGTIPGDKVSEVPAGARPSGDYPTSVTQAPPQTSNTPQTPQATGFTPGAKVAAPQSGSSAMTPVQGQAVDTSTPATTPQTTDATSDQQGIKDELQGLKNKLMQMQNMLTPPPAPPN